MKDLFLRFHVSLVECNSPHEASSNMRAISAWPWRQAAPKGVLPRMPATWSWAQERLRWDSDG